MKKHSNYPFEIPNGKLIETNDPCDLCERKTPVPRRWGDTFVNTLYAYNGKRICRWCASKHKVI